jgi:hypothetical protein
VISFRAAKHSAASVAIKFIAVSRLLPRKLYGKDLSVFVSRSIFPLQEGIQSLAETYNRRGSNLPSGQNHSNSPAPFTGGKCGHSTPVLLSFVAEMQHPGRTTLNRRPRVEVAYAAIFLL